MKGRSDLPYSALNKKEKSMIKAYRDLIIEKFALKEWQAGLDDDENFTEATKMFGYRVGENSGDALAKAFSDLVKVISDNDFRFSARDNCAESPEIMAVIKKHASTPVRNADGDNIDARLILVKYVNSIMRLNDAIDKVFMDISENTDNTAEIRRIAHSMVDWRRRPKSGLMIAPISKSNDTADRVCENVSEVLGNWLEW